MLLASPEETEAFGRALAEVVRPGDMIALSGDLGAGKTTLARGVLRALGHDGDITSPTFPIVIAYEALSVPVWHVDLYRVEDAAAIEQLGLDEALEDTALLIEWPERLDPLHLRGALRLGLSPAGEGARALTAGVPPAWEERWPLR